jgi:hypothetical protein
MQRRFRRPSDMPTKGTVNRSQGATGMRFVILRLLRHNELGVFHSYRRLGKERAKQRAINFDADVVDRVFPAATDTDEIELLLRYETDDGTGEKSQRLKRQQKNWRLEGNCPEDHCYDFVEPGCLFAMLVDAGARPARGAWAVYAADDPVAIAIMAHAESGQLTSKSMIALHGREGEQTLSVLRQSRPHLFDPEDLPVPATFPQKKSTASGKGRQLPPDPRRLVRILASVGHTLPSAVADIVDNAISKDATDIRITFGRPDDGHGRWMTITDDGIGMDAATLDEAMRIGSNTAYDAEDLGKYGYGLKGASWSQTDCFTVVSKRAGKRVCHLTWDVKHMDSWAAQDDPLEAWVREATRIDEHGTCVMWRDMRPPRTMPSARGIDPHTAEQQELERHLGLVFHRFLEGRAAGRKKVKIRVEGRLVEPNNPVGHVETRAYDKKTVRVPTSQKDAFVEVQAFLLPSEQEVRDFHGGDAEAARSDLDRLGMYGRRNESQGVYVYRNSRLIQWGGWHDMWATSDEKTKLARVTVEFGSDLDDQFAVNISKRMVSLSHQLQEEIKKLAKTARNDSKAKYTPPKPKKSAKAAHSQPVGTDSHAPGTASAQPPSARPTGGKSSASIPVRQVKTDAFAWKVISNMTGKPELQVNEREAQLRDLLQALAGNAEGMASLTGFLQRLDEAGVQKILVSSPPAP